MGLLKSVSRVQRSASDQLDRLSNRAVLVERRRPPAEAAAGRPTGVPVRGTGLDGLTEVTDSVT